MMKYIYITMVQLPTIANKIVRTITNFEYSHASLSFYESLETLYSFQVKNKKIPFVGGFMEETRDMYFHGKKNVCLKEMVFKIPVSEKEYEEILGFVQKVGSDKEYIFNYVSALFMFVAGGVKSYKAYHCVEFISEVLSFVENIELPKQTHKMHPKDLYNVLEPFKIEEKQIYSKDFQATDNVFLKDIRFCVGVKKSLCSVREAICRAVFRRTSKNFNYKNVNFYDADVVVERREACT